MLCSYSYGMLCVGLRTKKCALTMSLFYCQGVRKIMKQENNYKAIKQYITIRELKKP